MNKKLIIAAISFSMLNLQAREYVFESPRPVKLVVKQTENMQGGARPTLRLNLQPNIALRTEIPYFVQSITIIDEKTNTEHTWHSRMSGKGENVTESARRYYGYDDKLNRGGKYEIVAENDESKFNHENNKL